MKRFHLIALLILAGCGSASNDDAAPAPRQAGTLSERPVADAAQAASQRDGRGDEWALTDEERINRRIISLSGTPPSDDDYPEVAEIGDPMVADDDLDLSTMFEDDGAFPNEETKHVIDAEVFTVADVMPTLLDDAEALTITVTAEGFDAGTTERVIVQFVVDDQGRVRRPQLMQGKDGDCAQIAMLLARELSFSPGRQRGEPVHVRSSVPFTCDYQ